MPGSDWEAQHAALEDLLIADDVEKLRQDFAAVGEDLRRATVEVEEAMSRFAQAVEDEQRSAENS